MPSEFKLNIDFETMSKILLSVVQPLSTTYCFIANKHSDMILLK